MHDDGQPLINLTYLAEQHDRLLAEQERQGALLQRIEAALSLVRQDLETLSRALACRQ